MIKKSIWDFQHISSKVKILEKNIFIDKIIIFKCNMNSCGKAREVKTWAHAEGLQGGAS